MQRVLVLDQNRQPLMPCHPARARQLLRSGKAAIYRRAPFIIILKERCGGETQPVELRIDPGSKTTGLAVVAQFQRGLMLLWAANLAHRGEGVKNSLDKRRVARRSRRQRKTRYRAVRFLNRRRPKGWLPPSLRSRIDNVTAWARRLAQLCPLEQVAVEIVRFDTQKLINPEISGIIYQQGTLWGYEVKQYLLEKWGRRCAYCDAQDVPLQIEHIVPRSGGGSDRVSNLTLSCERCNTTKGQRDVREFLGPDSVRLARLLTQAHVPLRDAGALNATRYAIGRALKSLGIGPVSFWSGGRTKFNRLSQGYKKDHWLDAACVGELPAYLPNGLRPLLIRATGRGSRQMCAMDRYGFPRTSPKQFKRVHGFQTGDLVKAVMPHGKKAGVHLGRVAVRSTGKFRVGQVDGIWWRRCQLVQHADGYEYTIS